MLRNKCYVCIDDIYVCVYYYHIHVNLLREHDYYLRIEISMINHIEINISGHVKICSANRVINNLMLPHPASAHKIIAHIYGNL